MNLIALAESVSQIARKAGEAIMDIYNNEDNFQVEAKSDSSPLTMADRKGNEVIMAGLKELDVDYPVISEENKAIPYSDRKDFGYHWLVDPLDGTKEFIKRNGEFTVNIALIDEHSPVLGVVYAPVLDEMYWAVRGAGAFLAKGGEIEKLGGPEFSMEDAGLKVVCSRSHLNEGTQAFVDKLSNPEKVSRGSSLKFLLLATGQAHVYPRLAPTMEWDTGAAQMVLEEAGGKVVAEDTGKPLQYNKENLLNPHFIAYGNVQD